MLLDLLSVTGNKKLSGSWTITVRHEIYYNICIEYNVALNVSLHVCIIFIVILFLQKDLIREVEMGPFKHTLDDGLDIRKVSHSEYTPSHVHYITLDVMVAKNEYIVWVYEFD